ncbi:MAG: DUF4136 domain-containing protein [Emcibacter sp.]|nr:DUF4136 domain-containing protein [Emcibacter sp.]
MNKIIRILIVVGMVGLVSACNGTFRSNVSRFHELPVPKGETVMIIPADPAKNTSLEFASYANMVGSYLARQGYTAAGNGEADLIVELDYSVDDGKVMIRRYSSGFEYGYGYGYGLRHFRHHRHYRHFTDFGYFGHHYSPFYGFGYPYDRDIRSYVNYTRKLSLVIRPNKNGAKNLYEGTVESRGRSNDLAQLMPHLTQALFTNFPGESGATNRVVIELNQ